MNSVFLNPASIAGCNEKLAVSLFSVNVGVDNNLGTISSISDISKSLKSNDSGSTGNIFKYTKSNDFSMMLPMVEMRGPGVLYRINSRHTVALTTRVRVFNEFNNFNRNLYNTITNPGTAAQQGTTHLTSKNFNWTAHVWSEIGLSYGVVAVDNEQYQVKAGVSLKYLGGIGYLGLKGKNLDITYINGSDSVYASNSDIEFASNVSGAGDAFANGINSSKILGGANGGKGIGADLGITFLYNPDGSGSATKDRADNAQDNNYKLIVSASIIDLGAIKYNRSSFVNLAGNGYITGRGIVQNVKNYEDFRAYALQHGYSADTGIAATKVYLPASLLISADYNIYSHFYANAIFSGSLANDQNFGSKIYSQFSVIPRYDTKLISAGLPLTYNMLSHSLRIGLGLRITGFYLGSDDMMALFSGNQYGFNFYMGGVIPIFRNSK